MIFTNYTLDPAHFLAISLLAMQSSMSLSCKEIEVLLEMDVVTEFESNIRGGFTSVVIGEVTFSNKHLQNFDELEQGVHHANVRTRLSKGL